jgi:hypothetical protein
VCGGVRDVVVGCGGGGCRVCGVCGGMWGVWGVWVAWRYGRCGGLGSLLTFDIPQTALVATLDTYDFIIISLNIYIVCS